jgi:hypothetical protein
MAPRNQRQQSKAFFYPSSDTATYRDLLLFEERLKSNAAQLQRRKSRYQRMFEQYIYAARDADLFIQYFYSTF